MTDDPKKKPDPAAEAPKSHTAGSLQFGDGDSASSWFRRAARAGLRYTRAVSERSGIRLQPVLELRELDEPEDANLGKVITPDRQPGRQMFHTNVKQFMHHEAQRPKTVKFKRPAVQVDESLSLMGTLKRVFVVALVVGCAIGVYRVVRYSKLSNAAASLRAQAEGDLEEDSGLDQRPRQPRPAKRP